MKCPGQDSRYWKGDAIFEVACPKCGTQVEFFKDDATRRCPGCGHRMANPGMDFGCAAYCPYAEQCLGALAPAVRERRGAFRDRLSRAAKQALGTDFGRIGHLSRAARHAETLARAEGADTGAVLAAAHLAVLGLAPADASAFLRELGAEEALAGAAAGILAELGTGSPAGLEARVVHDAEILAALEAAGRRGGRPPAAELLTPSGRAAAAELTETIPGEAPGKETP
ncbi:phosphohydrolase [Dissulfurirhabdus thermomarina]|uniref:Phosphohydrolase n=1 Tax=Dissulfurirhabdus thermomarina TaxID=1765737 RepID=A0A6N9TJR3_DISTH|nr:phosphohydrolase [Dissulfurirhabdus thermomarina]NDY41501.1 phosphohydrolase [Dissulfurirhabdus thermomarina]NMX23872.1 phosphohydrolase [Dissulfurirhabdus thermomarina]